IFLQLNEFKEHDWSYSLAPQASASANSATSAGGKLFLLLLVRIGHDRSRNGLRRKLFAANGWRHLDRYRLPVRGAWNRMSRALLRRRRAALLARLIEQRRR